MSEVNNIPRLRFPSFYDEWKHDKLGNVINFQNGVGHERSIYENGNVVVVNSKFISTEGTVRKYTDKVLSIIPDDSLCMVMSDVPNGKAIAKCYYFETGNHFSLNQRICSIKSETEVNKFLFYRINRHKYYLKFDNGVGQTNLRKSEVLNCPIKLPTLSEQQKIADFLTAVDKRIELLEKKKTLLETYKKGVMKKIFNQQIRFKDDNGNDFPDWEDKRLGEVVNLKHGYQFRRTDFTQEGLPIIKIGNVKGTGLFLEDLSFIDENRYEEFKSFEIFNGDILMSLTGNIGRVIEVKNLPYKVIQNYRVGNFQPFDENEISKKFLKHLLETDQVFGRFNSLSNQSAQANFGKQDMDKIKVGIPNLEEQEKISEFLSSIDKQLELLETQIDKSKTWKKGLLQKMFV